MEKITEHFNQLTDLGCPDEVAVQILCGISEAEKSSGIVYISGKLRPTPKEQYHKFDEARDRALAMGFDVISPVDMDRADDENLTNEDLQARYIIRDFFSLLLLRKRHNSFVVYLDGFESSEGATGEFFLARWMKIPALDSNLSPLLSFDHEALKASVANYLEAPILETA